MSFSVAGLPVNCKTFVCNHDIRYEIIKKYKGVWLLSLEAITINCFDGGILGFCLTEFMSKLTFFVGISNLRLT